MRQSRARPGLSSLPGQRRLLKGVLAACCSLAVPRGPLAFGVRVRFGKLIEECLSVVGPAHPSTEGGFLGARWAPFGAAEPRRPGQVSEVRLLGIPPGVRSAQGRTCSGSTWLSIAIRARGGIARASLRHLPAVVLRVKGVGTDPTPKDLSSGSKTTTFQPLRAQVAVTPANISIRGSRHCSTFDYGREHSASRQRSREAQAVRMAGLRRSSVWTREQRQPLIFVGTAM